MGSTDPEMPVPTEADFVGSPFRLLPRIGDKLYRPTRVAAPIAATLPHGRGESSTPQGPGIWDWG